MLYKRKTIDQLWVKYSQGHFGFSVQKKIWLEVGGKVDEKTEEKLGESVGWRKKGAWLTDDNLTFNLLAPSGHLPWCHRWEPLWLLWVGLLFFVCFIALMIVPVSGVPFGLHLGFALVCFLTSSVCVSLVRHSRSCYIARRIQSCNSPWYIQ